jgi:threonine/homoserine/homoserine lactone efflux protein
MFDIHHYWSFTRGWPAARRIATRLAGVALVAFGARLAWGSR